MTEDLIKANILTGKNTAMEFIFIQMVKNFKEIG